MAGVPAFRIDTVRSQSASTIKLDGELDSASYPQLLGHFERAAGSADRLVLDLEAVSFIDSAGLRAIIVIEQEARERGVSLTVIPPPEPLMDLLQLSGIAEQVPVAARDGSVAPAMQFTERVELELAREPTAPGRARAELRQAVHGRLSEDDTASATLLVSEIVTNAVIHAGETPGASVDLRITTYPDRIRVEVSDSGPGFDLERLPARPRATGGHGLLVVDGLASRWGTERTLVDGRNRFCVWFELDAGAGEGKRAGQDPDQTSLATA